MSTLQRANLGFPAYLGTSAGAIYDNATGSVLIVGVTLFNSNTTNETVKLYCVVNSASALGTAGATNQIAEVVVAPKDTVFVEIPYGIMLTGTHDSLQGSTTTASKVTAMAHGDKIA